VEFGGAVKPGIEQAFEGDADAGDDDEAERQRRDEADAPVAHRQHDHVAAQHGEAAMGEVDEAHQAHGDGEPDRYDEQHHPGGEAAEHHARYVNAKDHQRPPVRLPYQDRATPPSFPLFLTAVSYVRTLVKASVNYLQ